METIQETRTPEKTSIEGSQGVHHRLKARALGFPWSWRIGSGDLTDDDSGVDHSVSASLTRVREPGWPMRSGQ